MREPQIRVCANVEHLSSGNPARKSKLFSKPSELLHCLARLQIWGRTKGTGLGDQWQVSRACSRLAPLKNCLHSFIIFLLELRCKQSSGGAQAFPRHEGVRLYSATSEQACRGGSAFSRTAFEAKSTPRPASDRVSGPTSRWHGSACAYAPHGASRAPRRGPPPSPRRSRTRGRTAPPGSPASAPRPCPRRRPGARCTG